MLWCVEFVTHIINVRLSKLFLEKNFKPIAIKDLVDKMKIDGPNLNARPVDPKLKSKRVVINFFFSIKFLIMNRGA